MTKAKYPKGNDGRYIPAPQREFNGLYGVSKKKDKAILEARKKANKK